MNISLLFRRTLVIFAGLVCVFCFLWINFLRTPLVTQEDGIRYTVQENATLRSVIHELYLLDIIKKPVFFRLLARGYGSSHALKSGEYLFQKGTTPDHLLDQIMTGRGMVQHEFTIVAGWSFAHLRRALLADANLKHISKSMDTNALMEALGATHPDPEGAFFPDTYFFVRGTSDLVILHEAFLRMQKKLHAAWEGRETGLPFKTPLEALTAASLIEKETGINHERPLIAGVIVNRLEKNMLLQIDPTVIYAAGTHFSGTIRRTDLLRKSPYNTYVTRGLPPGPISIPGMASILAVMHPEHHRYYYFVAKNYNLEGEHRFSGTLQEHYSAIARARRGHSRLEFFNDSLIWHYFSRQVLPGIYP